MVSFRSQFQATICQSREATVVGTSHSTGPYYIFAVRGQGEMDASVHWTCSFLFALAVRASLPTFRTTSFKTVLTVLKFR